MPANAGIQTWCRIDDGECAARGSDGVICLTVQTLLPRAVLIRKKRYFMNSNPAAKRLRGEGRVYHDD